MKKFMIMLVVLVAGSILMSGCATLVDSPAEQRALARNVPNIQSKQFVDDWNYLWLYERSSSLSEWHPYVGR